jgi:hypothetical protein
MKPALSVRLLTAEASTQLAAERRGAAAFRVRRAPIILASACGRSPKPMAQLGGCGVHTVRNVMTAVHAHGLAGLTKPSTRPKSVEPPLDASTGDRLQPLLHQSPRTYGTPTGGWPRALAAEVGSEQGVTKRLRSDETIRRALKQLQTHWKRAKHGRTRPAPHSARKTSGASA